ncbi:MAG: type II toxin-antitoxin system RelE/ParE family toxin [Chloroflexi bacterium]|nr:type II toxin-antitoxin system RelE/ParE family toxin [Chloroflexota bacterium]
MAGSRLYEVRLRSRRVERELNSIPANDFPRIVAAIEALAGTPRPVGAVQIEGNIFRLRVGRFRVLYRIDDGMHRIDIGGIRRRSERTYRRVRDLF